MKQDPTPIDKEIKQQPETPKLSRQAKTVGRTSAERVLPTSPPRMKIPDNKR